MRDNRPFRRPEKKNLAANHDGPCLANSPKAEAYAERPKLRLTGMSLKCR